MFNEQVPVEVGTGTALAMLRPIRDALAIRVEQLALVAENARRACMKPQQELSKLNDAIRALEEAEEWANGTAWEVPL